jgi:ketosteroid isomerase-like protein
MGVAENVAMVRRFYALGALNDPARAPMFTEDAVWYVPGNNPVSGPYHGIAEMTYDMGRRMQPLDDWRVKVVDIMGCGDMVVSVTFIIGERRGRKVDMLGSHVFTFDDQGRIAEVHGFAADQAALDAFFNA